MTSKKITVNTVEVPAGGIIGMTHCPGRRGIDGDGYTWQRDLERDVSALSDWGASAIVTLLEAEEFGALGVASLAQCVAERAIPWYHWPVPDMQAPGPAFFRAFRRAKNDVDDELRRGNRIVLHCAAGLGRTGTVAASLLIRTGIDPEVAITRVRHARPGAIETQAQESFVLRSEILSDGEAV